MFHHVATDFRLGVAKAVTQKPLAAGLLLPHWHADVAGAELIAGSPKYTVSHSGLAQNW
jgi:hypothetical protein